MNVDNDTTGTTYKERLSEIITDYVDYQRVQSPSELEHIRQTLFQLETHLSQTVGPMRWDAISVDDYYRFLRPEDGDEALMAAIIVVGFYHWLTLARHIRPWATRRVFEDIFRLWPPNNGLHSILGAAMKDIRMLIDQQRGAVDSAMLSC